VSTSGNVTPLMVAYKLRGDIVSRPYVIEYLSRRGSRVITVCMEMGGDHCHVTIEGWVNGALKITGTTAYFLTAAGARLMAAAWTEAASLMEEALALRERRPVLASSLLVTLRINRKALEGPAT
jgi:hypothetical protein